MPPTFCPRCQTIVSVNTRRDRAWGGPGQEERVILNYSCGTCGQFLASEEEEPPQATPTVDVPGVPKSPKPPGPPKPPKR